MNFLFVTMPQYTNNGAVIPARKVFDDRIASNKWAIYSQTKNRKSIAVGDNVAFFVSNRKNGGEVAGFAQVKNIITNRKRDKNIYERGVPEFFIEFENISILNQPLLFRSVLEKLSFCPENLSKWGAVLMGGVRRLSDKDLGILKLSSKIESR